MKLGFLATVLLCLSSATNAQLVDRDGGMIYDTDQDLTWLKDANYSRTQYIRSGGLRGDKDGFMDWNTANAWARSLLVGGYNDWRLPSITETPPDRCNFGYDGTNCGYNTDASLSEIAYMFHSNLGNVSLFNTKGNLRIGISGFDWGLVNRGPFDKLFNAIYWTSTEFTPYTENAWAFLMHDGYQFDANKGNRFLAWAVRSGDVKPITP
ncbi:MAG: DUF1566 domain-containing protein [Methylococcales bacterium]